MNDALDPPCSQSLDPDVASINIRGAAVAAKNQNEPEDGTDLPAREPWQQRQIEHEVAVPNELAKLDA